MELFMRTVVGVQIDDGLCVELACGQCRRPAFERVVGRDQHLPLGVDGALDQAQHTAHGPLHALDAHAVLPHRQALANARRTPRRCAGTAQGVGQCRHVGAARVPLDQPIDLRQARGAVLIAGLDAAHDRDRVEAGVKPRQHRRLRTGRRQALRHRDDALQVEVGRLGRVLHARAQRQLQAKAVAPEVGRQRAIAINAGVGAPDTFLGCLAVVHCEGVDVQRQPATGQDTVVRALSRQQRLDHRWSEVEQLGRASVHALAQRRARGQQRDGKGVLEERIAAEVLDRVEVALALLPSCPG